MNKKKIIASLLVFVMLFITASITVFAENDMAYTAKIGTTNYRFLQQAVNAVMNDETITLLRDCDENPLISRTVRFTLNNNGFNFTGDITKGSDDCFIEKSENVYNVSLKDKGGWTVSSTVDREIREYIKKEWEKKQTGVFIAGHRINSTGWYENDGFPATAQTGSIYIDFENHTVTLNNASISVSSQPVEVIQVDCPRSGCSTGNNKVANDIPYEGVLCLTDTSGYSAGSGACRLNPYGHYYMTRGYKSSYSGTDYFATIGLALLTNDNWSVTLTGNNSIEVNAQFDHPDSTGQTINGLKSGDAFGIYATGALTLSGTGSLNETITNNGRDSGRNSSMTGGASDCAAGIHASSINITSGTYDITVQNTSGKVYTAVGANGVPTSETSQTPTNRYGAISSSGDINISGSNTVIAATDKLLLGSAINSGGSVEISNGADVTANELAVGEVNSQYVSRTRGIYAANNITITDSETKVKVNSNFNGIYAMKNILITDADVTVDLPDITGSESVETYDGTISVNSGKYKKLIQDNYVAENYYEIYGDDYYNITNTLPDNWDAVCGSIVYFGENSGNNAVNSSAIKDEYGYITGFNDIYLRQNSNADITDARVGDIITVYLAEGVSYTGNISGKGLYSVETVGDAIDFNGVSVVPHIYTLVVDPEQAPAKIVSGNTETYYSILSSSSPNGAAYYASADNTLVLLKDLTFDYTNNYASFFNKSYNIDFNGYELYQGYTLYASNGQTVNLKDTSAAGNGGISGTSTIIVRNGGRMNISGGVYDMSKITVQDGGTLSITGGTFSADPSQYVAEGYEAAKTGDVWVVSPAVKKIQITGKDAYIDPLSGLGNIRFLASVNTDDPISAYGIWIVSSNYLNDKWDNEAHIGKLDGNAINETKTSFDADITDIAPEAFETLFFAKSFITANNITTWSDVASASVAQDNHNK